MLVRSAGCLCYGAAIRRSFHEGIGSRYDEISGLDRAVPNWNVRAWGCIFPLRRSEKSGGEISLSPMKSSAALSPVRSRVVTPARNVLGSLRLPGDKSISHRYAMLAGFAEGTSHLTNFSSGADPHSTLACMEQLGAQVERGENGAITIAGCAGTFQRAE